MNESRKVEGKPAVRGMLVTSLWTLVSRVLGLARDIFMTSALGATGYETLVVVEATMLVYRPNKLVYRAKSSSCSTSTT